MGIRQRITNPKPSLQDITAMSWTKGHEALVEWYDPNYTYYMGKKHPPQKPKGSK